MKKQLLWTCLLSIPLLLPAQQFYGEQAEIDAILSKVRQFSQFVMQSDYDGIAGTYTLDGKIFPNNADIITGFEAIKKRWTLPEGIRISYHKIKPLEIRVLGEFAHDHGYYEGTTIRADGSTSDWKGKYVVVWQKVDGQWLMYLDIWNRIANQDE